MSAGMRMSHQQFPRGHITARVTSMGYGRPRACTGRSWFQLQGQTAKLKYQRLSLPTSATVCPWLEAAILGMGYGCIGMLPVLPFMNGCAHDGCLHHQRFADGLADCARASGSSIQRRCVPDRGRDRAQGWRGQRCTSKRRGGGHWQSAGDLP